MSPTGFVTGLRSLVRAAEEQASRRLASGQVQDEPTVTGEFFGAIDRDISPRRTLGRCELRTKVFRGIGRGAPEKAIGADAIVIMHFDLPGYRLTKGVLIQSKLVRSDSVSIDRTRYHPRPRFIINSEFHRMQDQCRQMLSLSASSYVLLYMSPKFAVVPANAIAATTGSGEIQLYAKEIGAFFAELGMCFIGDSALDDYDDSKLTSLIDRQQLEYGLLLTISEPDATRLGRQ